MNAAVDLLRAKGLATAAKKSSRTAAEGLVGVAVDGTKGTAVEVNSQTDFVAKNEQFQDFVRKTTGVALGLGARPMQHFPRAGLSVYRPGSRAGTNTGLVHPSLANRSDVRGSARPSGNGDAAAMVRAGYRTHDAGNSRVVFDHHAGGQRIVGGTNNADPPRCLARKGQPDLLRYHCLGKTVPMERTDFLRVGAASRCRKNSPRIIRAPDGNRLLRSLNG